MHDGHPHGSCGDCERFVSVFPEEGPDDWGYCHAQDSPSGKDLTALREAYLAGNRAPLRNNRLGVFRTEDDDCCDLFRPRGWFAS